MYISPAGQRGWLYQIRESSKIDPNGACWHEPKGCSFCVCRPRVAVIIRNDGAVVGCSWRGGGSGGLGRRGEMIEGGLNGKKRKTRDHLQVPCAARHTTVTGRGRPARAAMGNVNPKRNKLAGAS